MNSINQFSLANKVIIVTGGTGILGGSFVTAIAQAGGIPIIIGRNETVATARANEVIEKGGQALAIVADVLVEADLIKARDLVLEEFGRIDGLVNGAGGNMPEGVVQPDADIFSMNLEGMKRVMELNLFGTILPTQIFGAVMLKNGGGSIVNISSVSSKQVITKVLGYSMGKAAVDCYNQWFVR